MPGDEVDELAVRLAAPGDLPAVVALCAEALGWDPTEPNEALFRWKHVDNAYGPSPIWVAEDGRGLVGVRAFLRWEFVDRAGVVHRAVRAVDTATAPRAQGRGVFSRLTRTGVEALRAEGVAFVFNTPNDRSRPGYLKMGWQELGAPPVAVAPGRRTGLARTLRARTAAEKWSTPAPHLGRPASEVLTDRGAVGDLLAAAGADRAPAGAELASRRTPEVLAWRYGLAELAYRAVTLDGGDDLSGGLALVRLRRRGPALEAVVADLVVPEPSDPSVGARLLAHVRRVAGADHVLVAARHRWTAGGALRVPGLAPTVTWRALCTPAPMPIEAWDWRMGDLELF